jgi:hypothetical protein
MCPCVSVIVKVIIVELWLSVCGTNRGVSKSVPENLVLVLANSSSYNKANALAVFGVLGLCRVMTERI